MPALPLSLPLPALNLRKNRPALIALWLAFLAGLAGADAWFTHGVVSLASDKGAIVEVGPTPLPLVAGVNPADLALSAAPDAALEESSPEGKLPVIAKDGRTPLAVYAYPFDHTDARPKVSVVLMGVGLEAEALSQAIQRLPGAVSLAFNVYTPDVAKALANARAAGHETLLTVPADGRDPTTYDPGPGALRGDLSVDENMQRLHLLMGQGTGYVGLLLDPATRVLDKADLADALLADAKTRGLELVAMNAAFAEQGTKQGAAVVDAAVLVDPFQSVAVMDGVLAEAEQRARESGAAVVLVPPYPVAVERLAQWLPSLSGRGLALAPVSALAPKIEPTSEPASESSSDSHHP